MDRGYLVVQKQIMDFSKIRREYIQEPMALESLDPDPMRVFDDWMKEAYKYYGEECNAMTLATSDRTGRPSARTVLLKGITSNGFIFYTNYQSRKGQQIDQNPRAAILFYWAVLDRQIRIEGPVIKVSDQQSDLYFQSRPPGSRISAMASPQSSRITMEELQTKRKALELSDNFPRPSHWGGYEVKGEYFEFWNGQENRFHDRFIYEQMKDGTFDRYRIAP